MVHGMDVDEMFADLFHKLSVGRIKTCQVRRMDNIKGILNKHGYASSSLCMF